MSPSLIASFLFAIAFALFVVALRTKGNARRQKALNVAASVICVFAAVLIFIGFFV